jgi:hypothetical protein
MAGIVINVLFIISVILLIVGGLNWGWVGITSNNFVHSINNATFKNQTVERWFYAIIGLAALYVLFTMGIIFKND